MLSKQSDFEIFDTPSGKHVEFYPDTHTYVVDGETVPSVTTLLTKVYGNTYAAVNEDLLRRAAEYGTAVHEDIEQWIDVKRNNPAAEVISPYPEVLNFFNMVEPIYKIEPILTEKVVVFSAPDNRVVAAGRFDLLCTVDGVLTLADFKTTSVVHRELVTAQLNLYLHAAIQSGYLGAEGAALGVIHLSGEKSRYIPVARLRDSFLENFYNCT